MMKYFLVFLLALFSLPSLFGQNKSFRNYNYKWPEEKMMRMEVDPQYANEPAVILNEKTNIEILEDKFFEHFQFNYYIEKELRIRYQSENGIASNSKFSLPETFDPFGSYYGLTLEQQKTMHRPKGDFDVIIYFVARIIKPDGSIINAEITDSSEIELFYLNPTDKNYVNDKNSIYYMAGFEGRNFSQQKHFGVHFRIKNLAVNDELEIRYAVKHVFMPSRIFFNGTLPKQSFDLTLKTDNRGHIYFVNQFNGAAFKDSLLKSHYIIYHWVLKNLYGAVSERGARLYKELPYISIHRNNLDYGEIDNKGAFLKALPYTWPAAMLYFVSSDVAYGKDILNSQFDKSNIQLLKWIDEKTAGVADSNTVLKTRMLHNDITENFDYHNDDAYFSNLDNSGEKLGDYLEDRKLREISRFRLYTRMFEKIQATYYKTLLLDKRGEQMTFNRFEIPSTLKISFCIPHKNQAVFMHPKESRYGWYDNELPFYYEDIPTILVPQSIPAEDMQKQLPVIHYINIKTPFSDINANHRSTNVLVTFHPDTGIVTFNCKVDLKGQYSTMTRGSYLYDYLDETSNPLYHQLVWQLQDDITKPNINITNHEKKYPFEFAFHADFNSRKVLLKNKTDRYFLDLNNWFQHVIDSGLDGSKRQLSYFPDFTGTDTYRYYIKCGKPVTIINATFFEKNIEFAAGSYIFRLTQPQPDAIMIESSLSIKTEKIKPNEVQKIEEIYDAVRKNNTGLLEIKYAN